MPVTDPNAAASSWVAGLSGSGAKITAGVNAVQIAPGITASKQVAVWQANTVASAPKWQKNTAAIPLQSWQTDMIQKGVPRISTGAQAAQNKMVNFFGQLLPYIQQQKATLPPRGNYSQNVARMTQWVDKMHQFSYNKSAS